MSTHPMKTRLLILALAASLNAPAAAVAGGACQVREADLSFFKDQAKSVSLGTKMRFSKVLLQEKFDVRVSGGVAILTGNVSSKLAIRTAGKIAQEDDGIRCVQNHLKVGPPLSEPGSNPY